MFSHVIVGVSNFERALAFYRALMPVLDIEERFCERERPWAGWQSNPGPRPLFLIGRPYDNQEHEAGNGQMVAFLAESREVVLLAYEVALASGGTSEGAPGLRTEYHPNYFGAYFRDTEGNKVCVACHSAPG
jgi:catechol 2,3-dioxygenase-like lactoylglutathione lyase family enzyme